MTYDLSEFDPTAVDLSKYTKIVLIAKCRDIKGSVKTVLHKVTNNSWRVEHSSSIDTSEAIICKLCGVLHKEEQSREHSGCKELYLPTELVPNFILKHKYCGYDTIVFE